MSNDTSTASTTQEFPAELAGLLRRPDPTEPTERRHLTYRYSITVGALQPRERLEGPIEVADEAERDALVEQLDEKYAAWMREHHPRKVTLDIAPIAGSGREP